jgi:hypothetical protein
MRTTGRQVFGDAPASNTRSRIFIEKDKSIKEGFFHIDHNLSEKDLERVYIDSAFTGDEIMHWIRGQFKEFIFPTYKGGDLPKLDDPPANKSQWLLKKGSKWMRLRAFLKRFGHRDERFAHLLYIMDLPGRQYNAVMHFSGGNQALPEVAAEMKKILENAPRLQEAWEVWRCIYGWNVGSADIKHYRQPDRTYAISTTDNRSVAVHMGDGRTPVFRINLEAGSKVLFLGCASLYPNQEEVVIDADEEHDYTLFTPDLRKNFRDFDENFYKLIFTDRLGNSNGEAFYTQKDRDEYMRDEFDSEEEA